MAVLGEKPMAIDTANALWAPVDRISLPGACRDRGYPRAVAALDTPLNEKGGTPGRTRQSPACLPIACP
jgi:hypothetical protein